MLSSSDNGLQKNVPIAVPSHPRQYRAIGLIEGQYQRSQDHQTRGILLTKEGRIVDTVILGKVISVLKKHIDLNKPHLWVVYPRTRLANDQLQLQIAGVWEPETLHREVTTFLDVSSSEERLSSSSTLPIKSGYFSIRGEVVYASYQKKIVIVKIRQSPKHPSEKPKFFKLKLWGKLPEKAVGCFWDLQVQLIEDKLTIESGDNLGQILKKKDSLHKTRREYQVSPRRPIQQGDRPSFPAQSSEHSLPSPRRHPLPKPIKNNPSQPR